MENFQNILFDKSIYEINLLPQRSSFAAYGSEAALSAGSPLAECFSGGWHGAYREAFDPALLTFLSPESSLDSLPAVTVPLPLELQGYGKAQYTNVQYPFDGYNPGEVGGEILLPNPCMLYAKDYTLEEKKPRKRYLLNFKGSESPFFLYVNGSFVGYSENLFLDSEFDITGPLRSGSNRITVLCFRYCASTWLLDQDFFRFSGLTRDITLAETDEAGVLDIAIDSQVDSAARQSRTVFTLTGSRGVRRLLEVTQPDGSLLWRKFTDQEQVSADFRDLQLWSDECPNLYTLTIRTYREDQLVEIARLPFGFREVSIQNGVLLLNGKRLIFNGINRHEWSMEKGPSLSHADMEFDARFLKTHNINAVRTSHYPNHTHFYDLCDQYGLYLIDEACLESHGSQYRLCGGSVTPLPGDDPAWEPICVSKLLRMYERDKNHPAVLLWSLGNESGNGKVFARMRQALLERCPRALIHYEQCLPREDQRFLSDVYSSMYTDPEGVAAFIEAGHRDKPYILCEYAHAMGNSLGYLDRYRALLDRFETFQGGFVWDYIDQGLLTKNHAGKTALCYGGDLLDKPNDRDFCCNGILFADRALADRSAKAATLQYYCQPIGFSYRNGKIHARSRYCFRDTEHLDLLWTLLEDGKPVSTGRLPLILAPGEERAQAISWERPASGSELLLRMTAVQRDEEPAIAPGTVIAWEEAVLCPAEKQTEPPLPAPTVVDGYFNIGVSAGKISYLFTKSGYSFMAAGLNSIRVGKEEFLVCEPRPTVFRPATSNDIGCKFNFQSSLALSFSKNLRCDQEHIAYALKDGLFTITYRYWMNPQTREGAAVTYTVDGAGHLRVEAVLDALTGLPSLPLFGLHFQLPVGMDRFHYFGRGPYDNYPDRKKGTLSGIYESRCSREFMPYIYPQECGNHEEVRCLTIHGHTASLRFDGCGETFSFKYLPNSDFEIDNATHVQELPDSGRNHLTICGFTRGVGGDDSWGSPVHPPFTLPGGKSYRFAFTVIPTEDGES